MKKTAKKQKPQFSKLIAFDIETNQYFSYEAWAHPSRKQRSIFPDIWDLIHDMCSDELQNIPADCLSGFEHANNIWNQIDHDALKENFPDEYDGIKSYVDALLSPNGDFAVKPMQSEVYLSNFLSIDWQQKPSNSKYVTPWHRLSEDDFKQLIHNTSATFCHDLNEIDNYLQKMEIESQNGVAPIVLLIHNLSYEMNNALLNCSTFKRWIAEGRVSFLTNNNKDSYKSVDILGFNDKGEVDPFNKIICIRDTWKLTNRSIEAVGRVHGYPKLDYRYDVIRHKADLQQHDYDYNKRDCEISLLAAKDAYSQAWEVFEEKKTFPVSANSIVSSLSKHLFQKAYQKQKKNLEGSDRHLTEEMYADYKPTTGGGLVCVCPQFAYTPLHIGDNIEGHTIKEISHIDLISAHPSQAFKRLFPISCPQKFNASKKDADYILSSLLMAAQDAEKMCTKRGIEAGRDMFSTLLSRLSAGNTPLSGYATFTFYNIRTKIFDKSGLQVTMPTLWKTKICTKKSGVDSYDDDDVIVCPSVNCESYAGKIVEADRITVKMTFEDFITNACLFYEFDDLDISDIYLYKMAPIEDYLYEQFSEYGNRKNAYKKLTKAVSKHNIDAVNDAVTNASIDANDGKLIVTLCAAGAWQEAETTADKMLGNVKAQFNGVYGTSYQSLFRDSSTLSIDDDGNVCWNDGTKYDDENVSAIDIMQGSYIAQWSRVDIALHMRFCYDMGAIPLYVATDSIFYMTTERTNKSLRPMIESRLFNRQTPSMEKLRPNTPDLGGMDFENDLTAFVYVCALKNVYVELIVNKQSGEAEEKIKTTLSGCEANVYFEGCETFDEHARRLTQPNARVSMFETKKTTKNMNIIRDDLFGYVLENIGVTFNDTQRPDYQTALEYAYYRTRINYA